MSDTPPAGYQKLPDGTRCRCIRLWRDGDGGSYCCQQAKKPTPTLDDFFDDIRIVVQRHREQAAAEEREKVVAWLVDRDLNATAYYIKHKEHLK